MPYETQPPYLGRTLNPRPQVKYMVMLGDSLSDRGTLNKRLLFGWLPFRVLSGLKGTSPDGRFTNGLAWSDHITAQIASDFTIKHLEKKWQLDHTDISDAIITRDRRILHAIHDNYSLDNDEVVHYKNRIWVRSFCEGGLMAHDYSWYPSTSIKRFISRIILRALKDKQKKLIDYDKMHHIGCMQKGESLVIEWSGANDLVTVNKKPSIKEVDRAITARVANIKRLIASGYKHFVVFNLPDLSQTPRYQLASQKEQENAKKCTQYFNIELINACKQINEDFPYCHVRIFDIDGEFNKVYQHPEQFLFDKSKLKTPYLNSPDFKIAKSGTSPATGYMFYDDVHPTADMHAILAAKFYELLQYSYQLLEPDQIIKTQDNLSAEVLTQCFYKHYRHALDESRHHFFGHAEKSKYDPQHLTLEAIFEQAIFQKDRTTKSVLVQIGWFNQDNELILNNMHLKKALNQIKVHHREQSHETSMQWSL